MKIGFFGDSYIDISKLEWFEFDERLDQHYGNF